MPELPEVETIRRQIEEKLVSSRITGVSFFRETMLRGEVSSVVGKTILAARRFGKLLVIDFSEHLSLCVHLKMTGRLILLPVGKKFPAHTHVVFHITLLNEERYLLSFSDSRRFGYLHLLDSAEVASLPFLMKLGREPLKDLMLIDFHALCKKTKRPIKTLLLDQQRISGIGNIYACESLWMARINPLCSANMLTDKQMESLFTAIEEVLREGLARGGASDNSYRNLLGGKGDYQNFFKVYMRTGKPCLRCSTPISYMRLGGRGTFFCPQCLEEKT